MHNTTPWWRFLFVFTGSFSSSEFWSCCFCWHFWCTCVSSVTWHGNDSLASLLIPFVWLHFFKLTSSRKRCHFYCCYFQIYISVGRTNSIGNIGNLWWFNSSTFNRTYLFDMNLTDYAHMIFTPFLTGSEFEFNWTIP